MFPTTTSASFPMIQEDQNICLQRKPNWFLKCILLSYFFLIANVFCSDTESTFSNNIIHVTTWGVVGGKRARSRASFLLFLFPTCSLLYLLSLSLKLCGKPQQRTQSPIAQRGGLLPCKQSTWVRSPVSCRSPKHCQEEFFSVDSRVAPEHRWVWLQSQTHKIKTSNGMAVHLEDLLS